MQCQLKGLVIKKLPRGGRKMNAVALDDVWMFLTYEIESDYNSLTKMSPKAIFTRDP